ncbi:MAG: DUF1343 domain-containing protein [Prevotellaceae bacterium]|jgi:uncharacterized protein YbbC (DUF1343 family)|nr:DUF1343 domain-containing protein [Prevotellaceae bacterium]
MKRLLLTLLCSALAALPLPAQITVGAAQFDAYIPMLQGKRVGVTANHTSIVDGGAHLIDELLQRGVQVARIYAPEHGFRGTADAGAHIRTGKDEATGLAVVSLYGKTRKPTPEQLRGIDCMVFDMQDVGLRFFTYLSTLHYVMEACAEQGIPLILLDRPNPNGFYVDGPVLQPEHRSFVGMHPIPVVHGMTLGELANMINGERWLNAGIQCRLTVIPCLGYTHRTLYELPVQPSPNLPNMQAVYLYASLCFFEGTAVSLGRGTAFPFQTFGHPAFKGAYRFSFVPKPTAGAADPPLKGDTCYGIDLRRFPPTTLTADGRLRLEWLLDAYRRFDRKDRFFTPYFSKLWGTAHIQTLIVQGATEAEIRACWADDVRAFCLKREKYLRYK